VNAGASMGRFLMAPPAGALLVGVGWSDAMRVLALWVLLALSAAFALRGHGQQAVPPGQAVVGTREAVRTASRDRSCRLPAADFLSAAFMARSSPPIWLALLPAAHYQLFDATGSCDTVWIIDIVRACGAALIDLPTRESVVARTAAARTARGRPHNARGTPSTAFAAKPNRSQP
jgi:hypothetical protein